MTHHEPPHVLCHLYPESLAFSLEHELICAFQLYSECTCTPCACYIHIKHLHAVHACALHLHICKHMFVLLRKTCTVKRAGAKLWKLMIKNDWQVQLSEFDLMTVWDQVVTAWCLNDLAPLIDMIEAHNTANLACSEFSSQFDCTRCFLSHWTWRPIHHMFVLCTF